MAFSRGAGRRVDEHRAADPEAVRAKALALLVRREYASGELAVALVRKGYAAPVVNPVVATLVGERLIDDTRYAESLVRLLAGRGQGPARIRQQLRAAGLPDEQVTAVLASGPDWSNLAAEVRKRKFGGKAVASWPERARQMRFLQYRGFSKDHIASALGSSGGITDDDS